MPNDIAVRVRQWGLYFILYALFQLLIFCAGLYVAGFAVAGMYAAQANEDLTGYATLVIVGLLLMITAPIVLIDGLIAGFGMRGGKPWSRMAGIIAAVFSLIEFPIGTLFAIAALRFLFSQSVKDYYI